MLTNLGTLFFGTATNRYIQKLAAETRVVGPTASLANTNATPETFTLLYTNAVSTVPVHAPRFTGPAITIVNNTNAASLPATMQSGALNSTNGVFWTRNGTNYWILFSP